VYGAPPESVTMPILQSTTAHRLTVRPSSARTSGGVASLGRTIKIERTTGLADSQIRCMPPPAAVVIPTVTLPSAATSSQAESALPSPSTSMTVRTEAPVGAGADPLVHALPALPPLDVGVGTELPGAAVLSEAPEVLAALVVDVPAAEVEGSAVLLASTVVDVAGRSAVVEDAETSVATAAVVVEAGGFFESVPALSSCDPQAARTNTNTMTSATQRIAAPRRSVANVSFLAKCRSSTADTANSESRQPALLFLDDLHERPPRNGGAPSPVSTICCRR